MGWFNQFNNTELHKKKIAFNQSNLRRHNGGRSTDYHLFCGGLFAALHDRRGSSSRSIQHDGRNDDSNGNESKSNERNLTNQSDWNVKWNPLQHTNRRWLRHSLKRGFSGGSSLESLHWNVFSENLSVNKILSNGHRCLHWFKKKTFKTRTLCLNLSICCMLFVKTM